MNELTELDNAGSPEPGLRLRKGHMSDTATTQAAFEEDSSEHRLLLVEPPLSSDQESVSYMIYLLGLLGKMTFDVSTSVLEISSRNVNCEATTSLCLLNNCNKTRRMPEIFS